MRTSRPLQLVTVTVLLIFAVLIFAVVILQLVRWKRVRGSGGKWQAIVAALGPTWAKRVAVAYILLTAVLIGLVVAMDPH